MRPSELEDATTPRQKYASAVVRRTTSDRAQPTSLHPAAELLREIPKRQKERRARSQEDDEPEIVCVHETIKALIRAPVQSTARQP